MGSGRRDLARELSVELETCMERVELATALLRAFGEPIPEYKPEFRHLHDTLSTYQISGPAH
jgi:hypothetical protein